MLFCFQKQVRAERVKQHFPSVAEREICTNISVQEKKIWQSLVQGERAATLRIPCSKHMGDFGDCAVWGPHSVKGTGLAVTPCMDGPDLQAGP